LGVFYRGFHSDCAVTVGCGDVPAIAEKFLEIGRRTLSAGIAKARVANHIGDISFAIETILKDGGYGIVANLTGHGVGRQLHEEPLIPNFGQAGTGVKLTEGMVIAIEPIYTTKTNPKIYLEEDGWTVTSEKGTLAGHFEHTIAITKGGPIVLTEQG